MCCPPSFSSRSTRIGSSSIASTTGRSLAARAEKTPSPFRRQFPASTPARSFTRASATANSSTRSPTPCRTLANRDPIRRQAPSTDFASAPTVAMASAASAASSRSTKTVSKFPSAARRRSSSRTRLVLPIRRCAVSRVWVPSRTRSASASSSISRSKNRSGPSTQLAPAFRSVMVISPTQLLETVSLAIKMLSRRSRLPHTLARAIWCHRKVCIWN